MTNVASRGRIGLQRSHGIRSDTKFILRASKPVTFYREQGELMIRLIALAALFFLISACRTTPVRDSDSTARPAVTRSLETEGGPPPPTPSSLQRTDSIVENRFLGHLTNRRAGLWLRVADVGQGQCVVGVTDNGYSFLIDAGRWTLDKPQLCRSGRPTFAQWWGIVPRHPDA